MSFKLLEIKWWNSIYIHIFIANNSFVNISQEQH
jgi:hypothetical protein